MTGCMDDSLHSLRDPPSDTGEWERPLKEMEGARSASRPTPASSACSRAVREIEVLSGR